MLRPDGEGPLALDGSAQRAHLPAEYQLVERQARAAGRISESCAAVLDLEVLDRDRVRVEADRWSRPGQPARWIEAQGELGSLQFQIGCTPSAVQKIPQGKFDP